MRTAGQCRSCCSSAAPYGVVWQRAGRASGRAGESCVKYAHARVEFSLSFLLCPRLARAKAPSLPTWFLPIRIEPTRKLRGRPSKAGRAAAIRLVEWPSAADKTQRARSARAAQGGRGSGLASAPQPRGPLVVIVLWWWRTGGPWCLVATATGHFFFFFFPFRRPRQKLVVRILQALRSRQLASG
ncbi:hypothetical protein IWX91DRAFT_132462 [Phyllosticta citricarpa]